MCCFSDVRTFAPYCNSRSKPTFSKLLSCVTLNTRTVTSLNFFLHTFQEWGISGWCPLPTFYMTASSCHISNAVSTSDNTVPLIKTKKIVHIQLEIWMLLFTFYKYVYFIDGILPLGVWEEKKKHIKAIPLLATMHSFASTSSILWILMVGKIGV